MSADLRALLDAPCTPDAWTHLTDALDAEPDADLIAEVVAWADGAGVPRRAPTAWVEEMSVGTYSARDGVVGVLDFAGLKLTGGKIVKAMSSPHLTSMRHLDVAKLGLTATFWKKLRALPSTKTLERFGFNRITDRDSKGVDGEHHCDALRRIDVFANNMTKPNEIERLMRSDLFSGVEVFDVEFHDLSFRSILYALNDDGIAPSVRELVLCGPVDGEWIGEWLAHDVMNRLETVSLRGEIDYYDTWNWVGEIARTQGAGTHTIDLSGLTVGRANRDDYTQEDLDRSFDDMIRMWQPPSATKQVRLGARWSEVAAQHIRDKGLEPIA